MAVAVTATASVTRLLLALCLVETAAGCASRASTRAAPAASTLRAAHADTTSSNRVYFAGEVPWPAAPAKGNDPPRNVGAPDGEARVRFVVGVNGRAEEGTFELVPGSNAELGQRLIIAARRWRFLAAQRADGSPVRQLVEVSVRKHGQEVVVDGGPAPRPR